MRDNKEVNKFITSQTALGRVGLPDDIGGVVASLLADDDFWITGQRMEAPGGRSSETGVLPIGDAEADRASIDAMAAFGKIGTIFSCPFQSQTKRKSSS